MTNKPDIVSLKWVIGLMNKQAESAEAALVEYGRDPSNKQPLLQCMWAVHQITSTLRALGMKKAEMLTLEMERSLNFLYKGKISGERAKLTLGGLMQGLKVVPAYLAHTQNVRMDNGRGLEQYVNDLRRWVGERPRPQAFFFHLEIDPGTGISAGQSPAGNGEIKSRANVMLALYLEMAKQALRRRNVAESMKTVARIARKMQVLFQGTEAERFWFTLIGLCEGIAGGLIVPDECIAQIFKAGAFMIKYARENGAELDETVDYDDYLQQMLYYVATCKARPVHIAGIRTVFSIDDETVANANQGLIHLDALVTALNGALEQLNGVVDYINTHDLLAYAGGEQCDDTEALDAIEAAQHRLIAAGQLNHADALKLVERKLADIYKGALAGNAKAAEKVVNEISRGIIDVKLDLEHKLEHGLCSSFSSREFELRESVINATFTQMSLVENYLHQILRRKALKSALDKKPLGVESVQRLTMSLHRHLNKTDKGHEELRKAVQDADNGDPDIDLLYRLAKDFLDEVEDLPDRKAIAMSLQLLTEIAGALSFADLERESLVIERCRVWLEAASRAGSVHEDEAFACFADAFAQIEMHLQRSIMDPLEDTSHMITFAEQRAAELERLAGSLAVDAATASVDQQSGAAPDTAAPLSAGQVQDTEIPPQFRDVFIEEAEEIVAELTELSAAWCDDPQVDGVLRDIRRHFHTFKGNGRAVGANVLGELGWAAQDMLDRVLDGELMPDDNLQRLVSEVVDALPNLVKSYQRAEGPDLERIRKLTAECFMLAEGRQDSLADDLADTHELQLSSPAVVAETLTH